MVSELLPIQSVNNVDVVDSRLIAIELDIQHKNFMTTIKKYKDEIQGTFGALAFETEGLQGTSGYSEFYYLNEDQAMYVMSLSKNTEAVRMCKRKLVKSFSNAKKLIVQQYDTIQELTLKLALANAEKERAVAEKNLLDTRHYITTALPEPLQQKILGYQTVKEVEKVEVVIDKESGKEYDGVGITYIAKAFGFKSNQQCWAWLEQNGYGKNSPKWHNELTAIHSQKLSRDDFQYLKDILKEQKQGRQLWLGE